MQEQEPNQVLGHDIVKKNNHVPNSESATQSREDDRLKYIKKIEAKPVASSTDTSKPAARPPRMGGCIPVSG